MAQVSSGAFEKTASGNYVYYKGFYNNSARYFFQFSTTSKSFNYQVTVTLTSVKSTMITTETTPITVVENADGTRSHSNLCITSVKSGKPSCSYILDTNQDVALWSYKVKSISM